MNNYSSLLIGGSLEDQSFRAITILIGNLQNQISAIDSKVFWLITFILVNLAATAGMFVKALINRRNGK